MVSIVEILSARMAFSISPIQQARQVTCRVVGSEPARPTGAMLGPGETGFTMQVLECEDGPCLGYLQSRAALRHLEGGGDIHGPLVSVPAVSSSLTAKIPGSLRLGRVAMRAVGSCRLCRSAGGGSRTPGKETAPDFSGLLSTNWKWLRLLLIQRFVRHSVILALFYAGFGVLFNDLCQ